MGGLDPAKILVVLIIALIVLGPERLPTAARQLGGAWRELNRLREKFEEEVRAAVPDLDLPKIPTSPSRAVTGYLSGLVSGMTDTSSAAATSANVAGADIVEESGVTTRVSRGRAGNRGAAPWYAESAEDDSRGPRRSLLGDGGSASRRPPAVPALSSGGATSADTVFLLDEPSMN